ncbi:hypothetical protein ACIBJI_40170 [Nocardia sp. NPDC050408]|uniref:hypothetical protein n=1 Tax=Nocardia sp. NPDC050408 TaxID=3364319 RepID=UPI00379419AB
MMKSLRRQNHSRIPHRLQLAAAPTESAAAGRELQIGSCTCGEMTPTPAWDLDAVEGAFAMHLQHQTALAELTRIRAALHKQQRGGWR